jgi:hypothetical protein
MKIIYILMLICLSSVAFAGSGSIWTTASDCGDSKQDVNHFSIGESVYVNGANFNEGTYDWYIVGKNGGASCDPTVIVASGNEFIDDEFCFEAYVVDSDDCGEYTVNFGNKKDNYRVTDEIPEFGLFGMIASLLGASAVFLMVRKK